MARLFGTTEGFDRFGRERVHHETHLDADPGAFRGLPGYAVRMQYAITKQEFRGTGENEGPELRPPRGDGWRLHSWNIGGGGAYTLFAVWERDGSPVARDVRPVTTARS